jgi:hypothetical protein
MIPKVGRWMTAVCALVFTWASMAPEAARGAPPAVIDIIGNLPVSEYNTFIKFNGYKDWGNEPSIAVNPTNANQIAVSSFAFNTSSTTSGASLWYSTNGGANWNITFPLQAPVNGVGIPNDQTFKYDSTGNLHGAFLSFNNNIYSGMTSNPAAANSTTWANAGGRINTVGLNTSDQPWIGVQGGKVFAAYDNFNSSFTSTEQRVAVSNNNGTTFTVDNPISRGGQLPITGNPGTRIATDSKGNVYSIFGYATSSGTPGVQNVSYRLNASFDGGNSWKFTNSNPNPGGLIIDSGKSTQSNGESFGGVNVLRGNITSIASDPNGSHIYTVYGKQDGSGVDRLFLAEFHPDPNNPMNLLERPNPAAFSVPGEQSALPSIAVTDNGTIFVLYDTFAGGEFHVHLAESTDEGLTFTDEVLYDFTAPFPSSDRELGDYQSLIAVGNTVYGTFPGRGNVNDPTTGVNTTGLIVPFFFSVSAETTVPEPATIWLVLVGGGAVWFVRRRF